MNVGKNTTLGNRDVPKKLVQFFIVTNGKLKMARDDTRLLVIARSIASQLKDFSSEIFEDGSKIDGCTYMIKSDNEKAPAGTRRTSTNALGVVSFPQKSVDTANGECESGFG